MGGECTLIARMMALFGYSFARPFLDRFEIRLTGELDEAAMLQVETELGIRLAHAPMRQLHVIFDLRCVDDYSLQARDVFVRIQKFVASRARRTAYVADRPNLRALALWAVRISKDSSAQVVVSMPDAEAWLGQPSTGGVPTDPTPSDRVAPVHGGVAPRAPRLRVGQPAVMTVRADILGDPK
jgi:hypothetical protein